MQGIKQGDVILGSGFRSRGQERPLRRRHWAELWNLRVREEDLGKTWEEGTVRPTLFRLRRVVSVAGAGRARRRAGENTARHWAPQVLTEQLPQVPLSFSIWSKAGPLTRMFVLSVILSWQVKNMKNKDSRLKIMNEILSGIKVRSWAWVALWARDSHSSLLALTTCLRLWTPASEPGVSHDSWSIQPQVSCFFCYSSQAFFWSWFLFMYVKLSVSFLYFTVKVVRCAQK